MPMAERQSSRGRVDSDTAARDPEARFREVGAPRHRNVGARYLQAQSVMGSKATGGDSVMEFHPPDEHITQTQEPTVGENIGRTLHTSASATRLLSEAQNVVAERDQAVRQVANLQRNLARSEKRRLDAGEEIKRLQKELAAAKRQLQETASARDESALRAQLLTQQVG